MAKDNSTKPTKPKFNSWWIYGILVVLIIGFQFLSSDGLSSTSKKTTSELLEYIKNGDVTRLL